MNSDIYKEQYDFEWNHRSHLTSAVNIPIAVATVLGGALVVAWRNFPFSIDCLSFLFVAVTVAASISLISAIVFLFESVHGYLYQRLPTPLEIKIHYDELLSWWGRNGGGEKDAKKDLEEFINLRLGEAVEKNLLNNKNKSAYIHKANNSLIFALIFLAISSAPFLIKTINKAPEIHKVQLVHPEQLMTEGN